MGMFDIVNVNIPCPNCGAEVIEYQSKDAGCTLSVVDPTEIFCFYSDCRSCGLWIEYDRPRPPKPPPPRDTPYTLEEVKALGFK